jgi:hypothetical protein
MAKGWKLGAVYEYNGNKVIVSAINSDGTLTLNYAAGSGKTGFAGKFAIPGAPNSNLTAGFNVPEADVDGDGISLEDYNNSSDEFKPLVIGDVLVTHDNGNVGKIVRIDDKYITPEYLKKHFPEFDGTYVGYAVQYDVSPEGVIKESYTEEDFENSLAWTTVVDLTEGGVTRRYVIERSKDEDDE